MSRKGNGRDNAPTESLWGSLKVGRLYGRKFATQRQAMDEVIDWLTAYNHRRLHSTLGEVSPINDATEIAAELQARAETAVNDRNSDFASGYATLALWARQQVKLSDASRLELLLRLDNMFDREYAGSVVVNDGNGRFFEPGSPRAWLLAVKRRQAF